MKNGKHGYENPLKAKFPAPFFASLPQGAGVYFMRDSSGEILYIGKAKCLRKRISSYRGAKPGACGDNVIGFLERVVAIDWEEHPTEQAAVLRERDLLRAVNPPFNIADNWPEDYFFVGLRERPGDKIEFRLTSEEEDRREFRLFGCYRHRRKVKDGYTALLRLFFAGFNRRARFSIPAKLARRSPPYRYELKIPALAGGPGYADWRAQLEDFFAGRDDRLLLTLVDLLLANETIPPFSRYGLQTDLVTAREFYLTCARSGSRQLLSHEAMRRRIRRTVKQAVTA
jgi:excinuclease UvrABC nuclease subunit